MVLMSDLQFDIGLENLPGMRFDAALGDIFFLVLNEPRDVRRLRSACLEIARCASWKSVLRVVLILQNPAISIPRLETEWDGLRSVLKQEIFERLSVIVSKENELLATFGEVPPEALEYFKIVVDHMPHRAARNSRRTSDALADVLRVLLIHWFRKSCPVKLKELGEQTGYSYPTIAEALDKLEQCLLRHSDRSVSLRSFPQDEWFKLVARADLVRSTQGFAVSGARPRPAELLIDKLTELKPTSVALGGTFGARHYMPGIDLVGNPRLDLNVDARMQTDINSIVRKLDPGLKPVARGELPQVAVHFLSRPKMFFDSGSSGLPWADEVECMLDLHEARLESQAMEFLAFLKDRART